MAQAASAAPAAIQESAASGSVLAVSSSASEELQAASVADSEASLTEVQVSQFYRDGFLLLRGWLREAERCVLQAAWSQLLKIFDRTDGPRKDHMIGGEKVVFALEPTALKGDDAGHVPLSAAINRVGHSLHCSMPEIHDFIFSGRVAGVCSALGFEKVVVPQSMFVNKPAKIGAELGPHVDSAFIYTEPHDPAAVLGFWTPLEPSTVKTGCLYAVPGSHKLPVTRIFKRGLLPEEKKYEWVPPEEVPMDISGAVPLEMAPGDLLLIHGGLVHYSTANTSYSSRLAFTWHLVDCGGGRSWSPRAWLQREGGRPFPFLY